MSPTPTPPAGTPSPSDDDLLDEALNESFPASDPIQPPHHEKLPPANAPGSDVNDQ